MSDKSVGEGLGDFYREWKRKLEVVVDRTKPFKERLAALHWIDDRTGGERTPGDDLEKLIDDLNRDN